MRKFSALATTGSNLSWHRRIAVSMLLVFAVVFTIPALQITTAGPSKAETVCSSVSIGWTECHEMPSNDGDDGVLHAADCFCHAVLQHEASGVQFAPHEREIRLSLYDPLIPSSDLSSRDKPPRV